jgi:enoyl-CoA hydratase/carnithine racemase
MTATTARTETVTSHLSNGVRTIVLNRPERLNAITLELAQDLGSALREANDDSDTRAVILQGSGGSFCSGDDLKDFENQGGTQDETRRHVEAIQEVTREMVLGDTFIVGAIHGWAVGGGLEWAINCDFPIWAENARGFFPEIGLGLFVTGAVTTLLPKLAGLAKAKELILFGERFDARDALACGIAWRVVPDKQLLEEATRVAERIAALPAMQASDFKHVINRACHLDAEGAMALETDATVRSFLDPETAGRVGAFGS